MTACDFGASREECGCRECREIDRIMSKPIMTLDQLKIEKLENEAQDLKKIIQQLKDKINQQDNKIKHYEYQREQLKIILS